MKQTLLILALITSTIQTFAQSPRIKLNQIRKDTVKGSVLISSPSDSGMVYSRDFYVAYGADTVLILYGDTIGGVGGGFASVLSDGVTVIGDGTTGNELKVDTSLVSTIQGLVDTLTNRGYLTANETITLSGDVTGSGTTAITATVVDDSHNHIISNVDFLQDSLTAKANASELSNYVTLSGTETISGAKTFTSDLNVDAKIALNDGDDNVVIGDGAGASLVNGQGIRNILIGTSAGAVIDSGDYNVANGYRALYSNTKGTNNVANGYRALYSNTTGGGNIANGVDALLINTTGNNNVANGLTALYSNTTGNNNVANGAYALFSLSSGSNNQAYGYQAGRYLSNGSTALTTANGSLFLGSNTKASANGNTNEIVIGTSAIGNGDNSVTIGASTNELVVMKGRMELNDGGKSVFIGDDAGIVDDGTDRRNVGIGYQALYSNTEGYYNVANGYQALRSNITGYINTAYGYEALYSNTSGNTNVANGYRALNSNTTGNFNVANGAYGLFSLSSGNNNQAFGADAGRYIDGGGNLTTANGSLFIGSNTRASTNNNSNEIVIGTDAIGNGSNTITIGSSTTQSLHTRNYEFDIDQTVGGATDNYVLTYDSLDGQISLEPISLSGSATLDFGSTSAQTSSDLTITVTGAVDGDVVSLGVPNASVNANTNYTAWVSSANTVTVRFNNYSSGAVDPASGTFKVKIFK